MKRVLKLMVALLLTLNFGLLTVTAQTPQKMSYQAVVRDASGELIREQQVGMQISILQGSADGTPVYTETQTPTTNVNGLVSIEIGGQEGFDQIDWPVDTYFIKTEIDPTGGTSYTIIGTSQLLSVPYALHAKTSDGLPIYTTAEIAALTPENGQAVFNGTEDLYQIYNGSEWKSFSANCWPQPTTASAGSDQTFTDGTVSATLAANTPVAGHGTGLWTVVSGTGSSFVDATNPTTTFSGTACTAYTLRWTISTNCSSSSDDVNISFSSPITDADGNIYKTVMIGTQLWMAENLKVTKEADGTAIPLVTDDAEWAALEANDTDKAYCYYSNSTDSLAKYGALYTYAAAKDACPTGWHLPTDAEWTELKTYIANDGHSGTEGTALKSTSGWYDDGNGTDNYGFSALPGGSRYGNNGTFYSVGGYGYWWSSTEYGSGDAYYRSLTYGYGGADVYRYYFNKSFGFSVRCIKD